MTQRSTQHQRIVRYACAGMLMLCISVIIVGLSSGPILVEAADGPAYDVKVVYFVPTDRQPMPQYEERLRTTMDFIQRFYAQEMQRNGYGSKTFRMERDAGTDQPVIRLVRGQHENAYYCANVWGRVMGEVIPAVPANGSTLLVFGQTWTVDPVTKISSCGAALGADKLALIDVPFTRTDTMQPDTAGQLSAFCNAARSGVDEPASRELYPNEVSVGELASRHFGGATHELGHAFGLSHQCYAEQMLGVPTLMCAFFDAFRRAFPTTCGAKAAPQLTSDDAAILDLNRSFNSPRTYVDNTAPSGSWREPLGFTELLDGQSSVTANVSLSDGGGSGLAYVHFLRSGDGVGGLPVSGSSADSGPFSYNDLESGRLWLLQAEVYDHDGNHATLKTVPVFTGRSGLFRRLYVLSQAFPYTERPVGTDLSPLQTALTRDYLGGEATIAGIRQGTAASGGRTWRILAHDDSTAVTNFNVSGGGGNYRVAYAYAEVTSPRSMPIELRIGSDDAIRVWLNGALVHERLAVRPAAFDEDRVAVTLRSGTNRLLFKVLNKVSEFQLYARLCNASTGQGLAELQYDPVAVNLPPTVNAWIVTATGPVTQITIPSGQSVELNGSLSDDGLPSGILNVTWSKQSGPGIVTFTPDPPTQRSVSATFSTAGTQPYILALTANDGELSTSATVSVTVTGAPTPPTVNAGSDQSLELPAGAGQSVSTTLHATAQNATTFAWSKVSGPATVQLGDRSLKDLPLTFTGLGTYVFRVRASNGSLFDEDDVQVTVTPPAPANVAPTVTINEGPQTITLPTNTVNLSATFTDDGRPTPTRLVSAWKCKSGPACAGVTFSKKRKIFTSTSGTHATVVTFPATPGNYVIRVLANDGARKTPRTVRVTVQSQVVRPPSTARISDDAAAPQWGLSIDGSLVAWWDSRNMVPDVRPVMPWDLYLYDAERPARGPMWVSQIAFGDRPFVSGNRLVWTKQAPTGVRALYTCTYNREQGTCPPQLILPVSQRSPKVPTMSGDRIVYLGYEVIYDGTSWISYEDIYTCIYDPGTGRCPEQRLTVLREITQAGFPINDDVQVVGSRLVFQLRERVESGDERIFTCLVPESGLCSPIALSLASGRLPALDGNRAVWKSGNNVSLYDFSSGTVTPLPLSSGADAPDISGDRVVWAAGSNIFLYRISTGQTQQLLTRPSGTSRYVVKISGERIVWVERNASASRYEVWMHDFGTGP